MSQRQLPIDRLWHLEDSDRGLTELEASQQAATYGSNDIAEDVPHPWLGLLLDTAKDPMLWFFAGTSALYAVLGQITEALTLLAAIVPLLGMDVYLHRRTQASTEGLKSRLATDAVVIRGGVSKTIAARDIVPGDLVVVGSGAALPADGVFVSGTEIQIDESALTGEAYPVEKRPMPPSAGKTPDATLDEIHWAYAGTRMLTGHARIRVAYTGHKTAYGEIVRFAVQSTHENTPLQLAIARMVQGLLWAAVALCFVLAGIRLYHGNTWLDALLSAVTLATAAIPEEFPVVFTFYLGVGVYRLAQKQALVRRAVTVENIGRVTCICSDKTGTITEGQLQLLHTLPSSTSDEHGLLSLASLAARNDSGDPMDEAIHRLTAENGIASHDAARIATFPFTEDRKRETTIARNASGGITIASKGAAEVILKICGLDHDQTLHWTSRINELAADAHKVIAVASRSTDSWIEASEEPDSDFEFAGLLAFEDPVRNGVREAVIACQSAGIHPMMVTGDHPLTARAVALSVGIGGADPKVISGDEMEHLVRIGHGGQLKTVDVISRAKPGQKLLLVQTLQQAGEIVAVTGDGVNDVPALKAANIGVAMGGRGTRSAREVASIVLLDDNFRTIVSAIAEGRQLFQNLRLSFLYLLIIHIPFVLTATLIPLVGYPLLYLPVHVVWLEMLIHPTAMLVFQDSTASTLTKESRSSARARFFTMPQWTMVILTGIVIAGFVTAGYLRSLDGVTNVEHGRAMAMATFTVCSAFVTAVLSRLRTIAAWSLFAGTPLSTFILIQTPGLNRLLHLSSLHWDDWALAILAGALAAGIPAAFALQGNKGRKVADTLILDLNRDGSESIS